MSDPLHDFFEASSLDSMTAASFAAHLSSFEADRRGVHPFEGVAPLESLGEVDDRLQRVFAARRSRRSFDSAFLEARAVDRILASVGFAGGSRLVPSAGGLDAVHCFGFGVRVHGPGRGQRFRYDAAAHAIQAIGSVPDESEVRRLFQLDCDGTPQLVLAFVADVGHAAEKYGTRAGRFVLQEAGHACQNVGLRLAHDGLAGYVLGGALDLEVLSALGLAHLDARLVAAMACGADARPRRRWRR